MNLYALIAAAARWAASVGGAGWWAWQNGRAALIGEQAREDQAARIAAEVAIEKTGAALAQLKIRHQTIVQEVQRETIREPVYRDCLHPAGVVQRVNAAITGTTQPALGSGVPPADAASR